MFFFFFDKLYYKPQIRYAFNKMLVNKMLYDGYCDMNNFYEMTLSKEEFLKKLKESESVFYILYQKNYPTYDKAVEFWNENITADNYELSDFECLAIINWVYKIIKTKKERKEFTKALFKNIKDFYSISNYIEEKNGVYYNSDKITLKFANSLNDIYGIIKNFKFKNQLFYRGHSDLNYLLLPSVFRSQNIREAERDLYQELLINCPSSFEKCETHLDKLVEM